MTSAAFETPTPAPRPTPSPPPALSPTATKTPAPTFTPPPTLDATATAALTQIASLASAVYAEQEDVRDSCDDLDGPSEVDLCQTVLNQTTGYAAALPQAIDAFVNSYNLSTALTAWVDNVHQAVSDMQAGIDAELSGLRDRSPSAVLSGSSQVSVAASEISSAVAAMQDSLLP